MRIYISQDEPTSELIRIVTFIVNSYGPILSKYSIIPPILNKVLKILLLCIQEIPENDRIIVQPVLARNSYWAHPEQILLGAIYDTDKETT